MTENRFMVLLQSVVPSLAPERQKVLLLIFIDFRDVKDRRDAYIKRLNDIYFNNLNKSKVELIRGQGTFVDKNKIAVGDDVYTADHILIAVGGYPNWPEIPGSEHGISSDGFFELENLPKKSVVVGAGYIAVGK